MKLLIFFTALAAIGTAAVVLAVMLAVQKAF